MYVTLNFDVEDTLYPPEERLDHIPGWIAQTLSETGLRGTFHVLADKARALRERGRTDVLAAMTEHDIGVHTDSNAHPLVPELVQDSGWADGVEKLLAYEQRAARAIKEAFWKAPVSTSRHAVFTSPQSYGAAAKMGLPYVYSTVYCPGHAGPVWFAGALCFPSRAEDGGKPGCHLSLGLEPALSHDDAFQEKMHRLAGELDRRLAAGLEYLTLFVAHPIRIGSKGWTEDFLFANGRNRALADLGHAYELRTKAELEKARENFRRFCEYLRSRNDVQTVGISRAAELFSPQPATVTRDTLFAYCTAGDDSPRPWLSPCYSAAELLTALAEALTVGEERGALPRTVPRRNAIGPVDKPVLMPERLFVSREEFLGLCRELLRHVEETGHLPANLSLGDDRIGLGSLHTACVAVFADACRGSQFARLRLQKAPRYPACAQEIAQAMAWIEESSFLGPEFSAEKLCLHTRLQAWSLKPACTSVRSGPSLEAGGLVPSDLISRP